MAPSMEKCPRCGMKRNLPPVAQPVEVQGSKTCQSCGSLLSPTMRICPKCGVTYKAIPPSSPPTKPRQSPLTPPKSSTPISQKQSVAHSQKLPNDGKVLGPGHDAKGWFCPGCQNRRLMLGESLCLVCGATLQPVVGQISSPQLSQGPTHLPPPKDKKAVAGWIGGIIVGCLATWLLATLALPHRKESAVAPSDAQIRDALQKVREKADRIKQEQYVNASPVRYYAQPQAQPQQQQTLITCPVCNGKGSRPTLAAALSFNGTIANGVYTKQCQQCGGKGFTIGYSGKLEQCYTCGGKGVVVDMEDPRNRTTCEACNGSGQVTQEEAARYETSQHATGGSNNP